jgi:hypothetical protein
MKRQLGVGMSGFIIICFLVVLLAILGFKLFTPYMQYFTIQKTFKALATNPEVKNGTRRDLMQWWSRSTVIDNITAINGDDIEVTKDGNEMVISASYSVKVPLFYNVSLLIDFNPSSAK